MEIQIHFAVLNHSYLKISIHIIAEKVISLETSISEKSATYALSTNDINDA